MMEKETISSMPIMMVTSVCEEIPFSTFCELLLIPISNKTVRHDRGAGPLPGATAYNLHNAS